MSLKPASLLKQCITDEMIQKAFQRVRSDVLCAVEGCRYELVHENRYQDVYTFLADHYCPDEVLCKNFGITFDEEMKKTTLDDLQQNMSFALVSSQTNEIVGLRIIRIVYKNDKGDPNQCPSEPVRKLQRFVAHKDMILNIFEHYKVEEVFALFDLTVHANYRHKGIGRKLMQAALLFIASMDIGPAVVRGNCTSNYSKRIYEQLGFETLGEIMFAEYKDGDTVIKDTGENKSFKMYGKIVH